MCECLRERVVFLTPTLTHSFDLLGSLRIKTPLRPLWLAFLRLYASRFTHSYPQVIHNLRAYDTDVGIVTYMAQD